MKPRKTLTNLLEMDSSKLKLAALKGKKKHPPVQVVIFVHAATDPVPENLMIALKEAVNPDEEGQKGKKGMEPGRGAAESEFTGRGAAGSKAMEWQSE